jgi:5-dehydro-2-deoxygluconokinase
MDPIRIIRRCATRTDYIHFKDIDDAKYADVMGRHIRFFDACAEGVMCPIGRGRIDYSGLRELLAELNYSGYITIEQERDPRNADSVLADLAASRDFLRRTGFRERKDEMKPLDVVTTGRSSVDLCGAQIGGRLEDMGSFEKYIGGSPTNIACGTARLGLASAVITGVGNEHMGRFIIEQLAREEVDTRGVKVDPKRLTALVILGIRDREHFPLIFYRENCADMALCEDDIDGDLVRSARSVVATGTHLSHSLTEAAVLKALRIAREAGMKTALDIDYRPNLWGVAGHGEGESRFVESASVTSKLQSSLHLFDLIVGTEEEFHIAGGSTDTVTALKAVRAVSDATLVAKRGALGAVAFRGPIPDSLDDGEAGDGFPIEVFNVLGAGDGLCRVFSRAGSTAKTGRRP